MPIRTLGLTLKLRQSPGPGKIHSQSLISDRIKFHLHIMNIFVYRCGKEKARLNDFDVYN